MPFPLQMFYHTWIVLQQGRQKQRYDIHHFKNSNNTYLHSNHKHHNEGLHKTVWDYLRNTKDFYSSTCLYQKNITYKEYHNIQHSILTYPHISRYFQIGPNCNTFVQYIIKKHKLTVTLPKCALGKDYKKMP